MATENKPLNQRKCGDCAHNKLTGWWDPEKSCEIYDYPVEQDEPACKLFTEKPR